MTRLGRKKVLVNILRGAASVLQIAPTRKRGLRELLNGVDLVLTDAATGQQRVLRLFGSNREALANDWRAVGADIRNAIGELKSEANPNA